MAKKSKVVREKKLIKNVEKYATVRAELKAVIKIQILPMRIEKLQ